MRTKTQVAESLATSIRGANPAIDTVKGPIPYTVINPIATEIASVEAILERVSKLYSILWKDVMTDAEIEAFGRTYGIPRGIGTPAIGRVTFYTSSRPTTSQVITIDAGTIVTTDDNSVGFQTLETVQIIGASADLYYNPTTRWYEISVIVTSLTIGEETEVAPYNVNSLANPPDGISGVENRSRIKGGTSKESKATYGSRVEDRFLGMSTGTGGGLKTFFTNSSFKNDLEGVSLVWSTDPLFLRYDLDRPGVDAYILGEQPFLFAFNQVAAGGETEISLPYSPALSVQRVSIDLVEWVEGASINGWMFQKDETPELKDSARANDFIRLTTPLTLGQTVSIEYTYDRMCYGLQILYDESYNSLFETDCLVRRIWNHPVLIKVRLVTFTSASVLDIYNESLELILDFVNNSGQVDFLSPKELRDLLKEFPSVQGSAGAISEVHIQKFTSVSGGTSDVEVVYFNHNEQAYIDDTLIDLRVVQ